MNRGAGVLMAAAVAFSACGNGSASESHEASIVGDWFLCEAETCDTIADDALRLQADGLAFSLDIEASSLSEAPICVTVDRAIGSYAFDGEQLRLGTLSVRAELSGDALTLFDVPVLGSEGPEEPQTTFHRRAASFDAESCPGNDPPPGSG